MYFKYKYFYFLLENWIWKSVEDVNSENIFLLFDKILTGHTSNLVWIDGSQKFLIFGGFNGFFYVNQIYQVDVQSYTWSQIDIRETKEYPFPRSYHSTQYDESNDKLIVYGGWNGEISNQNTDNFTSLWLYDIKSI